MSAAQTFYSFGKLGEPFADIQADELIRQKNTPVKYAGELYYNLGILYENYLGDNYHAVESYEKAVSYGQDKNAEKRLIRLYEKLPQRIQ